MPKGAIVKKGRDIDYSDFAIAFGPKKSRSWLRGIWGPFATSGQAPEDSISSSVEVLRKTWSFSDMKGVDAKGKLPNGNYWRYFGQLGESVSYHDVSRSAADYFDKIIDSVCYADWRE